MIWGVAVVTALMTAFYMFRLMSMTFFGNYRGPAWAQGGGHGEAHGASGQNHAVAAGAPAGGHAPSGGGGHGEWHGPHESPKSMTIPLQILAIGAVIAGFVGIPAALGGGNAVEHFLEPSFVARAVAPAQTTALATAEVPAPSEHAVAGESTGASLAGAAGERAVTPSPSSEGGQPADAAHGGGHVSVGRQRWA